MARQIHFLLITPTAHALEIVHLVVEARLIPTISKADGDLLCPHDLSRRVLEDAPVAGAVWGDRGVGPLVVRGDGDDVGNVASGCSRFAVVCLRPRLKVAIGASTISCGAQTLDQGSKDGDGCSDDSGRDLGGCPDDKLASLNWAVLVTDFLYNNAKDACNSRVKSLLARIFCLLHLMKAVMAALKQIVSKGGTYCQDGWNSHHLHNTQTHGDGNANLFLALDLEVFEDDPGDNRQDEIHDTRVSRTAHGHSKVRLTTPACTVGNWVPNLLQGSALDELKDER